jgi:1-phosphofructokinase/tagatose 6-phosphate kinase
MSQTEVIEYGPVVTPAEREALLEKVEYLAKGAGVVVLAGSLPRKVPEDFYAVLMQSLRRYRCYLVLDSYGEPLRHGVRARPHLVTPNLREAEDLVGHEFHDEQDIIDATAAICELGARNVIVKTPLGCVARFSRGRRSEVYRASITELEQIVSTVGSGDAFLAGFLNARMSRRELPDCLRAALAAGAANTQVFGAGMLEADEAQRLVETADVVELERSTAS